MLKWVVKKIEVIKSSKSGTMNFQFHKNEANDLQSIDNKQAIYYSLDLVNPSLNNSITPYYCYSQIMSMLLQASKQENHRAPSESTSTDHAFSSSVI